MITGESIHTDKQPGDQVIGKVQKGRGVFILQNGKMNRIEKRGWEHL